MAFPMMLVTAILFGNLAGAVGGEWQGTSRRTRMVMFGGVAILLGAFAVFGVANRRLGDVSGDIDQPSETASVPPIAGEKLPCRPDGPQHATGRVCPSQGSSRPAGPARVTKIAAHPVALLTAAQPMCPDDRRESGNLPLYVASWGTLTAPRWIGCVATERVDRAAVQRRHTLVHHRDPLNIGRVPCFDTRRT